MESRPQELDIEKVLKKKDAEIILCKDFIKSRNETIKLLEAELKNARQVIINGVSDNKINGKYLTHEERERINVDKIRNLIADQKERADIAQSPTQDQLREEYLTTEHSKDCECVLYGVTDHCKSCECDMCTTIARTEEFERRTRTLWKEMSMRCTQMEKDIDRLYGLVSK